MSMTGLEVFDKTVQTTNIWLDEIQDEIGPDRHAAWHVLGAVLRTLRDRLTVEQAAHLGAQLPILVRGVFYDQWRPAKMPQKLRHEDEFVARIAEGLEGIRPTNPEAAAKAVFHTLDRHVSPGEVSKLKGELPKDIRSLWDSAGTAQPTA